MSAQEAPSTDSLPKRIFTFLLRLSGSLLTAIVLMTILLVLTFYGTIYQSTYAGGTMPELAADSFFSSLFVVIPLGSSDVLGIPLPGMLITCLLLLINLIIGGIIKLRKNFSRWGIMLAHAGIAILLASVAIGNWQTQVIEQIPLSPGQCKYYPEMGFGIMLHRFTPEFYPGTQKPKSYESIISITDEGCRITDADHINIRMNEPFRIHGWTLYQMSWGENGGEMTSILRASHNPLEHGPKWASYIITIGLFLYYGMLFAKYLKTRHQRPEPSPGPTPANQAGSHTPSVPAPGRRKKKLLFTCIILVILAIFGLGMMAARPAVRTVDIDHYIPWSPEMKGAAASIAVEDGGRIKPFSTYAGFNLLRAHGKKSVAFRSEGKKITLSPEEWALDCMFRPEFASQMPVFLVNREETVTRLGLPPMPDKRKQYTFQQLEPLRETIYAHANRISSQQISDATGREISGLAQNLRQMELWMFMPIMAQQDRSVMDGPGFPRWYRSHQGEWTAHPNKQQADNLTQAAVLARKGAINNDLESTRKAEQSLISTLVANNTASSVSLRNRLDRELIYYNIDPLYTGLAFFVAGFVLLIISSLLPTPNPMNKGLGTRLYTLVCGNGIHGAWILGAAGSLVLLVSMVIRSMITMRSPVGNTYETIAFIACAGVIVALVMEAYSKRGIILATGLILGGLACQMGILYESGQATDHMDPLVAVLRSNFLLSTHVITIVLGYAAGLLASIISHVAVFSKPMGLLTDNTSKMLARMAYGALAFSLLFNLIGTVFGGIWGNEAWGRFWGWDPKENGALMIVLWQLIILHARSGGYIKAFGLHVGNMVGGIIIAFAWWGVNTMGVGLHSYGFSDAKSALSLFYYAESAIVVIAIVLYILDKRKIR